MLTYSINATQFSSIPILFYRSKLVCLDQKDQKYECSVEEACSNPNGYVEQSEYPYIYNLTMHLSLYCDRELLEAWIFTIANFGRIAANIILILFPFQKETKETFINLTSVVTGLALLSLYLVSTTFSFIAVFFIWYHSSSFLYGLIFSHLWEQYPESFQKYGVAYLNNSCPLMMVIYIIYTFNFGSWQNTLIHFTGIPLLLLGLTSLYLQRILVFDSQSSTKQNIQYNEMENSSNNEQKYISQSPKFEQNNNSFSQNQEIKNISLINKKQNKNEDLEELNDNHQTSDGKSISSTSNEIQDKYDSIHELSIFRNLIEKYFPFMNRDANLRRNFYIWTLGFASYVFNYYGVQFLINQLQGNLYFNCFLSTLFELSSSFLATALIVKFNNQLKKLIIVTQTITGIAFLSAFFIPEQFNEQQNQTKGFQEILSLILYLSPIIVAKITFEITPSLLLSYQKTVIPVKYQQSQYSCSNLITMILSNLVPFYKYFFQQIGVNPFIGFGIFSLFSAYQAKNFIIITKDKVQMNSDEN